MKKFEFLVLTLDKLNKKFPDIKEFIEKIISTEDNLNSSVILDKDFLLNLKLNKLGEDGWELVSVTTNFLNETPENTKFYFKREIPS